MPRADVTVTITGDVVRTRTLETAIEAVIRIAAEQPSPQSQPTLYNNQTQIQPRNGRVSRSTRLLLYAMAQSKAASRRDGNENRGRRANPHTRDRNGSRKTQGRRTTKPATESLTRGYLHPNNDRNNRMSNCRRLWSRIYLRQR